MAKYRVEFEYIEVDGSVRDEEMTVPLSPASAHTQVMQGDGTARDELVGPWIEKGQPYVGNLEDYEVAYLRSRPGVLFSPAWRFRVEEVN